jgi:hypothetical protein
MEVAFYEIEIPSPDDLRFFKRIRFQRGNNKNEWHMPYDSLCPGTFTSTH